MTQEQLIDQFCEFRGKCTTDDVVALNFAYKMLAPRWISVEDELPPRNILVITCDGQENINLLMLGGNGRWYDKAVGLHRNITHWMPLPQAPTCSEKPNNPKKGGEE